MLTLDADPRELMARAQAGDSEAFGELARLVRPYIAGVVYHHTVADRATIDDLVQETLLRAWRFLDHYRPDGPPVQKWLAAIARNVVVDHHRRRTSGTRCDEQPVEYIAEMPELATERDAYADVDDHAQVAAILEALPGDQRQALELFYLAELSGPEIALVIGCAEGTVKSRLTYARRAARRLVADDRINERTAA